MKNKRSPLLFLSLIFALLSLITFCTDEIHTTNSFLFRWEKKLKFIHTISAYTVITGEMVLQWLDCNENLFLLLNLRARQVISIVVSFIDLSFPVKEGFFQWWLPWSLLNQWWTCRFVMWFDFVFLFVCRQQYNREYEWVQQFCWCQQKHLSLPSLDTLDWHVWQRDCGQGNSLILVNERVVETDSVVDESELEEWEIHYQHLHDIRMTFSREELMTR